MNWIICPIRNGFHNTLRAVTSFLMQDIPTSVLLLDNSPDRIGHKVQFFHEDSDWRQRIWWVDNSQAPKSVAASWNQGLDFVFGKPVAHAMIAANDVVLRPETYRLLVEDGSDFVTPVGVGTMEQMNAHDPSGAGPRTRSVHPDFSAFLIRRNVFTNVGRFDEEYGGAYCEDLDYHLRMHIAGITAYSIGVPMFHAQSGTIKQADPATRQSIYANAEKNRQYFQAKWGFPVHPHDGGKYDEFFSKPRPDWRPFAPETWNW